MKLLLKLSQLNQKAVAIAFCFLLLPNFPLNARAQGQQEGILLAQATTTDKQNSQKDTKGQQLFTHNLEFNRSPIVGNRLRLQGAYAETRLGFTRPRGWNVNTVKALIRFQHSPALYANRSSLTVLVNDTSIGSIPLNRRQSQVGQVLLNIPSRLLQDYNEVKIVAQQNNSELCSDPGSPELWTEVLPDSKIIFQFQPKPTTLNFSQYPYPFLDTLSLEPNRIVYLQPNQVSPSWLTATSRLQGSFGRLADFRPIETKIVTNTNDVKGGDRLVIVGTPSEQPFLADLKLPVKIVGSQVLDQNQNPIPSDRGVLMMAKTKTGVPVLVVTGNGPQGVAKAAQFLSQPQTRNMSTGQLVFVDRLQEAVTPGARKWPRYLPESNNFQLRDIKTQLNGEPFTDVTVRGSGAPPIEIDFRALPDDRFVRGSSMNLVYSYGPQVNPRTSAVEVLLDGVFIGGARLTSESGETRKNLKVDLPANLVKPNSKLQVFFRMNSREPFDKQNCTAPPTEQLIGTIHAETSFDLKREISAQLPDLKLLQFGFPFAAPQDLSRTSVVLPSTPTDTDILTLFAFSERLGRLSQADAVKIDVYTPDSLPSTVQKSEHLVGIGTLDQFPFPEVFNKPQGFNLSQAFIRSSKAGTIQTPQDKQGMIKQVVSPWSSDRVVLALTAQTPTGLDRVRQVLNQDSWFFQLKQDTVLIDSNQANPVPYDPDAYQLAFFQDAPSTTRIEDTSPLSKISRLIQENWLLLPTGIIGISLLLYGIAQLYLKRVDPNDSK